ncbi:MAG: Cof-type HAD-IIB family hydrolase [Bacillota bacterium]|nr:Cof-type HAD-IIB family hydrolase [Bacillota bacterium]
MKNIKLVASDLDGTLLNQNKEITPRLYQALTKLEEAGVFFVPATGRPFGTVPQAIKDLPFLRYVITSNGAAIYDAKEKRNIIESYLTPTAVNAVIEIARELPVITEYFIEGKAYIAREIYDDLTPFALTASHEAYIKNSRTPVVDFWEEMKRNNTVLENINLVFRDMELRKEVWERLKKTELASITAATTKNIEITALSATKAKALEKLCEVLGLGRENVLAMGDGDNDMPMIQFAGIGVAMANGEPHILQAADIIADDCNDFGAAKILEQIIQSKQ